MGNNSQDKWDGKERRVVDLEAIKETVKEAMHEGLSDLVGYDLKTPEGKARFRSNQNYVDDLNQACTTLKKTGLKALASTGVLTLIAIFGLGLKEWIKQKLGN